MAINFPLTPTLGDTHTDGSNTWEYNGSAWDALYTATKAQVGLSNVDNTSDADKPVSTLQAAAIATAQAWEDILSSDAALLNVAVGGGALSDAFLTGNLNTAAGYQSLLQNESGASNTGTGYRSLGVNTTGSGNTATGVQASYFNLGGDANVATGYQSLYSNADGISNVATGYQALYKTTGSSNVGLGRYALFAKETGDSNVAVGTSAGRFQADGTSNLTSADDSIFIGALTKGVESATNQIVIGDSAEGLGSNTTVIGSAATTLTKLHGDVDTGRVLADDGLPSAPTYSFSGGSNHGFYRSGVNNLSIAISGNMTHQFWGSGSLYLQGSSPEFKIGDVLLTRDAADTLAQRNYANAQTFNIYNTYTSGSHYERAKIGWDADTFVIGTEAAGTGVAREIQMRIGGDRVFGVDRTLFNTSAGYRALNNNVSGSYGIAIGFNALLNSTASGNIGIGASCGSAITTGSYNLAAGYQSFLNSNGSYNIALGWQSARYQSGGTVALASADDSIFIGKFTKGVDAATNQIVIGDSAEGLGSNTTVLGSTDTVQTQIFGGIVFPDLPTADPVNAGELWNDAGTLKVSAG